mgnify:CR=1 FL=1
MTYLLTSSEWEELLGEFVREITPEKIYTYHHEEGPQGWQDSKFDQEWFKIFSACELEKRNEALVTAWVCDELDNYENSQHTWHKIHKLDSNTIRLITNSYTYLNTDDLNTRWIGANWFLELQGLLEITSHGSRNNLTIDHALKYGNRENSVRLIEHLLSKPQFCIVHDLNTCTFYLSKENILEYYLPPLISNPNTYEEWIFQVTLLFITGKILKVDLPKFPKFS